MVKCVFEVFYETFESTYSFISVIFFEAVKQILVVKRGRTISFTFRQKINLTQFSENS